MFEKISSDDRFADFCNDEGPFQRPAQIEVEFDSFFSVGRYDGVVGGVQLEIELLRVLPSFPWQNRYICACVDEEL